MREIVIESLQNYINIIEENSVKFSVSRGQIRDYPLLPGALRRSGSNRIYSKMDIEKFMNDFQMESVHYIDNPHELSNKFDLIVHAQHYGLPTYLLDFTYSHIISLAFAVEKAFSLDIDSCDYAVIWFADPEDINLKSIGEQKIVNLSNHKEPKSFDKPIFVSGNKINSRIYAQNGIFTYFNDNNQSLNEYKEYEDYLIKVKIPHKYCRKILCSLYLLGVRNISLYPELSAISKDILLKSNVMEYLKESRENE